MWTYRQADGVLLNAAGEQVGQGYSGQGSGKNNPAMQDKHNLGPIPQGLYHIGPPQNTVTHGPYVMPLTPDPSNQMFGRFGFLIHGDSIIEPGTASNGCIVMPYGVRTFIGPSADRDLRVVSGETVADVDGEISGAGG